VVVVIPDFARDPKVFPSNSVGENSLESGSDFLLVAINTGAIDVPVTGMDRVINGVCDLMSRIAIGTERAEADSGHAIVIGKNLIRD
jgi:hypothetical protein